MLTWSDCPAVERIPGKVSGAWLFKGTRVPVKALFDRCTPRQRRLLGDLGHDFRPGDFFYAPLDKEALMTGAA